ncbi:DUF7948 domain-containing protein [Hymenobacter tenuis]
MKQLYLFLCLLCAVQVSARASSPTPSDKQLEFIENRGQWPAPVLFSADVPGGRLFLEPTGLTYALTAGVPHAHGAEARATSPAPAPNRPVPAHAFRVEFVGAAAGPVVTATEPTQEVRNYLRGNDPKRWAHAVPSFRRVRYQHIWPGISAQLYENQQQQLEYDFELAPEANAAAIRLRYRGAESMRLTSEGTLEIRTSVGLVKELAPKAWQTDANGKRQPVPCAYVLEGQQVQFRLGRYDHRRALTIDPTVVFSSFTGSTADNWGFTATYDQEGNLYTGGIVFGVGYPASVGAYNETYQGGVDIALIKYRTTATGPAARVWATYLGGSSAEFPQSLVVNSRNELLILATTGSSNFPTTPGAIDASFNGGYAVNPFSHPATRMDNGSDLAVTRLSADGSRLIGSTYLGGGGNEGLLVSNSVFKLIQNYGDQLRGDILVDSRDNVYIASNSPSGDFPVRNNFQPFIAGQNGVVCKLSPSLDQLTWGSHLGGNQPDAAYSLQLDASGRVYVAGGTTSPDFPTTPGSVTPAQHEGTDGFIVRISADGSVLEKAAVLGTLAYDQAYFVQLDKAGSVYVLGQTLGNYPTIGGRYGVENGRQFIHKLNADLSVTEFATTFGSGEPWIDISPTAFLVDQCERIYVAGWGGGNNVGYGNGNVRKLPTTANATQRTTDGSDFYLMQLSSGAWSLDYATFFGGNGQDHVDGGTSRFDPRGAVYQAVCGGCGGSSSWPIPPGAGYYSTVNNSTNCNNAAFKYNFETVNVLAGTDRDVCVAAAPVKLTGSPLGGVWAGPGVSGSVAAGYVFTPTAALLGPQNLTYTVTGIGPCGGVSDLRLTVVPAPSVAFTEPAQTNFCLNPGPPQPPVLLVASIAGGTFSGPGVRDGAFSPSEAGPGTHTLVYTVDAAGCQLQTTLKVTVTQADAGPDFTVCTGTAPRKLVGIPAGGFWSGPGVSSNLTTDFVFTPTTNLIGYHTLLYTITLPSGCSSTSAVNVSVQPTPTFTAPVLPPYCTDTNTPVPLPKGAIWGGPGVNGPVGSVFTFTPALAGPGTHTLNYRTGFGLCDIAGTVSVKVGLPLTVNAGPDTTLCPGTRQPFQVRASPAGGIWSGPNVSPSGVFTPPANFTGSVTLTYTIPNACVTTSTRQVSVALVPTTAPIWTPAGCPENRLAPLTLTFSGGASTTTWDFGDGTPPVTGATTTHTYAQPGAYQPRLVTAYNEGRCTEAQALPTVAVVPSVLPPNIITPNGDPKNEFFVVSTACPSQIQIYSRWGAKVFEAAQYQNNWNGAGLPGGVYYYLLRATDGTTLKGWLTVQR